MKNVYLDGSSKYTGCPEYDDFNVRMISCTKQETFLVQTSGSKRILSSFSVN